MSYCHRCNSHLCRHNWRGVLVGLVLCVFSATAAAEGVYQIYDGDERGSCVSIPVQGDPRQHFLTIDHASDSSAISIVIRGNRYPAERVTGWRSGLEPVSLIRVVDPVPHKVPVYDIGTEPLKAGDTVYCVGFPFGTYAGRRSRVNSVQNAGYYTTAGVMDSGSSGGAVLTEDGKLVGIISSVDDLRRETLSVNLHAATRGYTTARTVQWTCTPQGCVPCYPTPPQNYQRYQRIEPRLLSPPRVEFFEQSTVPPPTQQPIEIDNELIASLVKQEITKLWQQNKDHLRGEPGPPGQDGADGTQISVEQIAEYLILRHAEELRGERGPAGPVGPRGPVGIGHRGSAGERGIGIQKIFLTDDNHLSITYTDGTVDRIGPIVVTESGEQSIPAFFDIVPKGQ